MHPTSSPTLDFYSFCKANSKMVSISRRIPSRRSNVLTGLAIVRGWERQRKEGVRALSGAKVGLKTRHTARAWREEG